MIELPGRRALLAAGALTVLTLPAVASCGNDPDESPTPAGSIDPGTEPTTATQEASPTPTPPTVDVEVDMAPARAIAVALATGNAADADIHQYLTGRAVDKADRVIADGADANASTSMRFGTVHHATTLNSFEKAERSDANGRIMLTVITFGWDAPPGDDDPPQSARANMIPGGPGTLAWFFTLEETTGLIDGIWLDSELGVYD